MPEKPKSTDAQVSALWTEVIGNGREGIAPIVRQNRKDITSMKRSVSTIKRKQATTETLLQQISNDVAFNKGKLEGHTDSPAPVTVLQSAPPPRKKIWIMRLAEVATICIIIGLFLLVVALILRGALNAEQVATIILRVFKIEVPE